MRTESVPLVAIRATKIRLALEEAVGQLSFDAAG